LNSDIKNNNTFVFSLIVYQLHTVYELSCMVFTVGSCQPFWLVTLTRQTLEGNINDKTAYPEPIGVRHNFYQVTEA